ncbi:MAG: DUF2203 family protein [Bacteroidota bacterium]|nr:DUF2203 family protein [Bacteroidota bacterium]MDP4233635.1 DUF2203 family protein [Bacteroidota bacterium]MDP4243105.1 DUF2203 family protein [Bacteroidota bacterium]MDP4288449.1 DUF2203 family protein [Bacteroidota bacterium]
MEFDHLFSLEEAQTLLAEIKPKLAEMVELKLACDHRGYDVYRHQYFGGMGPNGQKEFPPEMERLAQIASELDEAGIEVKDVGTGLIDFPHRRRTGEIVFLCYKHGEAELTAWHTIEGGFRSRKSLESL